MYGVHLDRQAGLKRVEEIQAEIDPVDGIVPSSASTRRAPRNGVQVLDEIAAEAAEGSVRVLMHSLAFGTPSRKFIAASPADEMGPGRWTWL